MKKKKAKILLAALLLAVGETAFADGKAVSGIRQINPTTVEITYSDGGVMTVDFYGQNVFRLFRDPKGGIVHDPASNPPARILLDNPRKSAGRLTVNETDADVAVATAEVRVRFDRSTGLMSVTDLRNGKEVVKEVKGRLPEESHHCNPRQCSGRVFLWWRCAERSLLSSWQAY